MLSDIISQIKTVQDLNSFDENIDILISGLYRFDTKMDELIDEHFKDDLSKDLRENVNRENTKKSENYLRDLKRKASELEKLEVVLAYQPTTQIVNHIYDFVVKAVGSPLVLDISVERNIVGGAKISFRGNYADYTLSEIIDKRIVGA